jgi:hypothetical protein
MVKKRQYSSDYIKKIVAMLEKHEREMKKRMNIS